MALATTACGGGDSHPAVASCEAVCAAQDALACDGAMVDLATCNQICAAYDSVNTECADAADALYTCQGAAAWECGTMGAVTTDAAACSDESAAFNTACAAE